VADYNYSTTQTLTRRELREQERSGVSAPPAPVVRGTLEARKTPEPKPSSGRKLLSWGTVIATPLLFIAVSLPVNLFYASSDFAPVIAGGVGPGQAGSGSQSFTVASSESSEGGVQRESWSVTSFAEVLRARYGSRNFSYSTTGAGRIRWPFPTSVPSLPFAPPHLHPVALPSTPSLPSPAARRSRSPRRGHSPGRTHASTGSPRPTTCRSKVLGGRHPAVVPGASNTTATTCGTWGS
jgi:hypothetical protein